MTKATARTYTLATTCSSSQDIRLPIHEISAQAISSIARDLWGSDTTVRSVTAIEPTSEHGLWRVCGCTSNLTYRVALAGHAQDYIMRFSRGYREDVFDRELRNYDLIHQSTSIPVPRVYRIDRTMEHVPTTYIVMDCMPGEEAFFLVHPDNPLTGAEEKSELQCQVGAAYAQIHNIMRQADRLDLQKTMLLSRLEQLEHVVRDGRIVVDLHKIAACRSIVEQDLALIPREPSLCVSDAELHLLKRAGHWQISFICDMEWVEFGEPYLDLVTLLCQPRRVWEVEGPLVVQEQVLAIPYLAGYQQLRRIDVSRLAHLALYHQLAVMCSITDQLYRPEKRAYMQSLEPIYVALVDGLLRMHGQGR